MGFDRRLDRKNQTTGQTSIKLPPKVRAIHLWFLCSPYPSSLVRVCNDALHNLICPRALSRGIVADATNTSAKKFLLYRFQDSNLYLPINSWVCYPLHHIGLSTVPWIHLQKCFVYRSQDSNLYLPSVCWACYPLHYTGLLPRLSVGGPSMLVCLPPVKLFYFWFVAFSRQTLKHKNNKRWMCWSTKRIIIGCWRLWPRTPTLNSHPSLTRYSPKKYDWLQQQICFLIKNDMFFWRLTVHVIYLYSARCSFHWIRAWWTMRWTFRSSSHTSSIETLTTMRPCSSRWIKFEASSTICTPRCASSLGHHDMKSCTTGVSRIPTRSSRTSMFVCAILHCLIQFFLQPWLVINKNHLVSQINNFWWSN